MKTGHIQRQTLLPVHQGLILGDLSQPQAIRVDKAVMNVADEILNGCVDVVVDLRLLLLVELNEVLGQCLTALLHTLSPTEHVGAVSRNSDDGVTTGFTHQFTEQT